MHAITVQINKEEISNVTAFIKELNKHEDAAAYSSNDTTIVIASTGKCSMAFAKALLENYFNTPVINTIK